MASVIPFLQNASFEPEVVHAMGEAYARACRQLDGEQNDLVKEVLAKRIIEFAQTGEHDPAVLCQRALGPLGER